MKKNFAGWDGKEYPNSQQIYQSLKEAFALAQDEVCQMPQDTRYRLVFIIT